MILPLMLSCIISTVVASQLLRDSIYTMKLSRRGVDIRAGREANIMRSLKVKDAMTREVHTVPANMPLKEPVKLTLEAVFELRWLTKTGPRRHLTFQTSRGGVRRGPGRSGGCKGALPPGGDHHHPEREPRQWLRRNRARNIEQNRCGRAQSEEDLSAFSEAGHLRREQQGPCRQVACRECRKRVTEPEGRAGLILGRYRAQQEPADGGIRFKSRPGGFLPGHAKVGSMTARLMSTRSSRPSGRARRRGVIKWRETDRSLEEGAQHRGGQAVLPRSATRSPR